MATIFRNYPASLGAPLASCDCEGAEVFITLQPDFIDLAVDGFLKAIIVGRTQNGDGTWIYEFEADDAQLTGELPEGDDWIKGVCCVCCMGEVMELMISKRGSLNRFYTIRDVDELLVNDDYELPRVPFDPGLVITKVMLTCNHYSSTTSGRFKIVVGGVVLGIFEGTMSQRREIVLSEPYFPVDCLPVLQVKNIDNGDYEEVAARGLVIDYLSYIGANPNP